MSHPRKRFNSDAERQTERRVRNRMNGFNTQGKPYQRHPNFINRAEHHWRTVNEAKREQRKNKLAKNLARYYRIAKENRAHGLRVDGRPFRRTRSMVETGWRTFRSGMNVGPVSFEDFGKILKREEAA